jgi:hypothetical protein
MPAGQGLIVAMKLVCEKYKEEVDSETAVCRRPTEYCKFRSSCMIHFVTKENLVNTTKENDRPVENDL